MTWALSKWMSFVFEMARSKASAADTLPKEEAEEPVRLARLMVCQIRRFGGKETVKVIGDSMSSNLLLGATPVEFEVGEKVSIELLLQGAGSVQLIATIDWMLESYTGRRVQLSFQPDQQQAPILARFLTLQKNGGQRGHMHIR